VIDLIRSLDDPYPYFRGLITDLGIAYATVEFEQPRRVRGITKNNFFTLYDLAMLGLTSHSKFPLRIATMSGFVLSAVSLAVSVGYLVAKLLFWDQFALGTAPVVIGLFFFGAVQLFFIGLLGEYVGAIHLHVVKRPLVVERERVNLQPGSSLLRHSGRTPVDGPPA
jgi:polyisoprenyl-phosphate glycosyltransferase